MPLTDRKCARATCYRPSGPYGKRRQQPCTPEHSVERRAHFAALRMTVSAWCTLTSQGRKHARQLRQRRTSACARVQGAGARIMREAEAFRAGYAAGREAVLQEKVAAEPSVTRLDQGRALEAEQALVQARDGLLRRGLLREHRLAARGAARAERLSLAHDAGVRPLHARACGQCLPGDGCRACGARPGVRHADASRHLGSSHPCSARVRGSLRGSTALCSADNSQHAHVGSQQRQRWQQSAHTAEEGREPQALGSLGAVDESVLEAPAGSATGQALQGEGARSTQVGVAGTPAAGEKQPAASAEGDAGEAPPRPCAPSANLSGDVGARSVSASMGVRNLAFTAFATRSASSSALGRVLGQALVTSSVGRPPT